MNTDPLAFRTMFLEQLDAAKRESAGYEAARKAEQKALFASQKARKTANAKAAR